MKENGTHTKTYNGNWVVDPVFVFVFGCLLFLAHHCSFFLAVRPLSSIEKMQTMSIFGKWRVGPHISEEETYRHPDSSP